LQFPYTIALRVFIKNLFSKHRGKKNPFFKHWGILEKKIALKIFMIFMQVENKPRFLWEGEI